MTMLDRPDATADDADASARATAAPDGRGRSHGADDATDDTPACGGRTAVSTDADASPDASFDVAPELFGRPGRSDAAR